MAHKYANLVKRTQLGDLVSVRLGLALARCSGGCTGWVPCKGITGLRGGGSADLNDAANKLVKGDGLPYNDPWRFYVGHGWTCPKHQEILKRECAV